MNENSGELEIIGFLICGEFFKKTSGLDVLISLLNELNRRNPGFFEAFSNHRYNHGTVRTYISRDKNDLHPSRPDLVEQSAKELEAGYWLLTNMSVQSIDRLIKHVVEVSGLIYNKDVIALLPEIPLQLGTMDSAYNSKGDIINVEDAYYDDIYTCIECRKFVHWRRINPESV